MFVALRRRSGRPRAPFLVGSLAVALLVTACAATAPAKPFSATEVRSTPAPVDPASLQRQLGESGIATVKTETSTTPLVAVHGRTVQTLTAWQVRNLSLELSAHGGVLGADLDSVLPMGEHAPPIAFVVAAWVSGVHDRAADTARTLIGNQDWANAPQIVFPTAVLDLFAADILAHGDRPKVAHVEPSTAVSPALFLRSTSAVSCSGVAGFVDGVLGQIFDALKLSPIDVANWVSGKLGNGTVATVVGTIAGFLASFWNRAVDLARATVTAVLTTLTAPVVNALRTVVGALETITTVMSYLKRWNAPITAEPDRNSFSVTGYARHRGSFQVVIDRHQESEKWPELLTDCAAALGKPVPTLSAEGSPVVWSPQPSAGLIEVYAPGGPPYVGKLDASLTDRMDYKTGAEDARTAKGAPVSSTVTVLARVRRTEIDQLADLLTGYLSANFPPLIRPTVQSILTRLFGTAKQALDSFTSVEGSASIMVTHHRATEPTPTVPAPAPAVAAPAINVCDLLPRAEASALTGTSLGTPKALHGGGPPGQEKCVWGFDDASLLVIPHDTTGYYRRWSALYNGEGLEVSHFQHVQGVGAEAVWAIHDGLLARWPDGTVIAAFNLDLNHNIDRDGGLSHDVALARTLYARLPH